MDLYVCAFIHVKLLKISPKYLAVIITKKGHVTAITGILVDKHLFLYMCKSVKNILMSFLKVGT